MFFRFIIKRVMFLKQVKRMNLRSFVYFFKNDNCTKKLHFRLTKINTSQTYFSKTFRALLEIFRH